MLVRNAFISRGFDAISSAGSPYIFSVTGEDHASKDLHTGTIWSIKNLGGISPWATSGTQSQPASRYIHIGYAKPNSFALCLENHFVTVLRYNDNLNCIPHTGNEKQKVALKRRETSVDFSRTTDALRRFEGEVEEEEEEEEDGKT